MIDATVPGSPGWWLQRLLTRLQERRPTYEILDLYYRGEQGIPIAASKTVKEAYRRLMAMSRTNFSELVVEAVRERMMPTGFRTGAAPDGAGDEVAWRMWQANSLDADNALVHRPSLAMGDAYVIVGGVEDDLGAPLITPEDPREVITECDPRRRRRTVAALKIFEDTIRGELRCFLYLPGEVHQAAGPVSDQFAWTVEGFEWMTDPARPDRLPAPVVPVVRFANRANTFGVSRGEFETHLPILDRINYTILSRLEIATLQAFRQRAIKGVPDVDEEGDPVNYDDIFAADPGAMWVLPATADVWESGQVDLGPIRQAIRDDVQDLAAVTRTPLFYLTPDSSNGSAAGASLAREGLIFKTNDRILQAGESWEQVMALAFLFAGDAERATRKGMEVLWAPPERFSLAERYDAAAKAQAAGVPWRTVMTDVLQFSPQQVDRMAAERTSDALLGIGAPAPAPTMAAANA